MNVPDLLQTKLAIPPARTELVARPRLIEQFNRGLNGPLTLLCAPAGFGKTTLLNEWLASETGQTMPLAWLSLDVDDNDPGHFLTYLIAALTRVSSLESEDLLSLVQTPQSSPKGIVTTLLSRLEASPGRFGLVLDDYHHIRAPSIHEALIFLLEHLPYQMHLIVTSREDPPFPLARMRGRGQLSEIRADDLRFTAEEAGAFLQQMLNITLSREQVQDLDERTEGWIAGLQLAALAMRGREDISSFIEAFTGSHRYILDYLTEEVLNRQPVAVQNFLLATSILGRLCGPLCNAVIGRHDGQQMLEQIERENLFLIQLDEERYWYRYHHLFGDMLRNRLRHSDAHDEQELHRRASRWLAEQHLTDEAVGHALAAKDYEYSAQILEDSGSRYFLEGWGDLGLKWAAQIPDDVMQQHPLLALNIGMWHGYLGRANEAQQYVDSARTGLERSSLPETDTEELLGYADTIEALSATIHYDTTRAISAADRALQRLPVHRVRLRGTALLVKGYVDQRERRFAEAQAIFEQVIDIAQELQDFTLMSRAMIHRGEIALMQGQLRAAESIYRHIIHSAVDAKQQHIPNVGIAYGELAIIQLERNQPEAAGHSATLCVERCAPMIPYYALVGYAVLARVHRLSGDIVACQQVVQQIRNILDDYPSIPARIYVLFVAHLWIQDPLFEDCRRFLLEQGKRGISSLEAELTQLVTINLLIEDATDETLAEAFSLLENLRPRLAAAGSRTCWLEMLILEVLALDATDRTDAALQTLDEALEVAEPEGFVRIFLDRGEVMKRLLRMVLSKGRHQEYVNMVLAAVKAAVEDHVILPASDALIEALSERELEVLRLVADGASNREIAEQLYISIGTVKKHMNNVFLKLDARSRTQATTIARDLRLL